MEAGLSIGHRYLLREPIGRGGMSVVWRAEDQILGREVAVKLLSADVAADPASLRRLYAEARAAARLRHDNVVEVHDYGETTLHGVPLPYVVMELVEGRSLSALLSAGPLSWRLSVLIGAQVAAALAAAHDQGVVHRDVKPANVMVAAGGVKLVDFGISAAVGERDTVADEIIGTPAYLAPERLINGTVRPATDVYALGVLLYMMLAGRMPWNASTTTQMLIAHRYRDPAPLPPVPGLPGAVVELVQQCLAKTPSDRPPAVTAARILRQAAGLPPALLLTTMNTAGDRAADTPTEEATAASPTAAAVVASSAPRALGKKILAWPPRHKAAAGAGVLVAAAALTMLVWPDGARPAPADAAAAATPLTCEVTYAMSVVSPGRSSTTVTVANTASAPTGPWTLSFRLPGEQRLVRGADASWRQSGDVVEAKGVGIPAGSAASTWFDTRYTGVAFLPQAFALNEVACRSELSVRSPAATPAVAEPAKKPKATPVADRARPRAAAPTGHRPAGKQSSQVPAWWPKLPVPPHRPPGRKHHHGPH